MSSDNTFNQYAGWIATVSGRHQFSAIGKSQSSPTKVFTANVRIDTSTDDRALLIWQKRDGSDSTIYPAFLRRIVQYALFSKQRSRYVFILIGRTTDGEDRGQLDADVYILAGYKDWRSYFKVNFKKLQSDATRLKGAAGNALEEGKRLHPELIRRCAFHARVIVQRDGCTYIRPSDTDELGERTSLFKNINGNPEFVLAHANQVFHFLRDLSHRHIFHSPSTDTITYVHAMADGDERTWRRRTLMSLYRAVMRYKQTPSQEVCICSLGMIPFLEQFQAISKNWINVRDKDSPERDLERMQKAIESARELSILRREQAKRKQDVRLTLLFGIIGVAIGAGSLVSGVGAPESVHPAILRLNAIIYQDPVTFIGLTGVLILGMFFHQHVYDSFREAEWFQHLIRTIVSIGLRRSKGILILVMAAIMTIFSALLLGLVDIS